MTTFMIQNSRLCCIHHPFIMYDFGQRKREKLYSQSGVEIVHRSHYYFYDFAQRKREKYLRVDIFRYISRLIDAHYEYIIFHHNSASRTDEINMLS